MKTVFKYISKYPISCIFIAFITLILSCTEDSHSAYGGDSIAPGKVIVNSVENTPGGAVIRFTPPIDSDLLYIKGKYRDENDIQKEVIVSSYIDSLNILGFGLTGDYPVDVTAIDIGDNESEKETVIISPLEAPIHAILESIEGAQDFGGINISYLNPTRAEISLNMSVEEDNGEIVFKESFFTSQANSSYSFRGYDAEPTVFVIYVEDRWGNQTLRKSFEITPLQDEFLDKGFFSIVPMPGDESFSEYGFSANQI